MMQMQRSDFLTQKLWQELLHMQNSTWAQLVAVVATGEANSVKNEEVGEEPLVNKSKAKTSTLNRQNLHRKLDREVIE